MLYRRLKFAGFGCLVMSYALRNGWLYWGFAASFYFYQFILRALPTSLYRVLTEEIGLRATEISWVVSSYDITYCFMLVPVGLIYDGRSEREILTWANLICMAGCLVMSLGGFNWWLFCAGRVIQGVGSAFGFLGCIHVASKFFPAYRMPLVVGLASLSGVVGAAFATSSILNLGMEAYGWNNIVLLLALPPCVFSCFMYKYMPTQRNCQPFAAIMANVVASLKSAISQGFGSYTFLLGVCTYVVFVTFVIFFAKPFFLNYQGLSTTQANFCVTLMHIGGGGLGAVLNSYLVRIFKSYLLTVRIGLGLAVVWMAIMSYQQLSYGCLLLLSFLTTFNAASQFIVFSIVSFYAPQNARTTTSSLYSACTIGGVIFTPLAGFLLDWSGQYEKANGKIVYFADAFYWVKWLIPMLLLLGIVFSFRVRDLHLSQVTTKE